MFDTTIRGTVVVALGVLLTLLLAPSQGTAQIRYMRGQNVAPVFEGWHQNEDGTFSLSFGYMNRNHEELIDLPVGPQNFFAPGPVDRGQPTHFNPRRHRFVFTAIVPETWGPDERLTWTLTVNGRTDTVQGWLQPEWEADDGVIQMNLGPGGTPPANERPEVTGSPAVRTALGDSIRVHARATDDGIPRPSSRSSSSSSESGKPPPGLRLRWIHYRGPGAVTFGSPTAVGEHGKPVEAWTDVQFDAPGDYVLRAIAFDRLFEGWHDVAVTVTQ